jgi:hypothetical protein
MGYEGGFDVAEPPALIRLVENNPLRSGFCGSHEREPNDGILSVVIRRPR